MVPLSNAMENVPRETLFTDSLYSVFISDWCQREFKHWASLILGFSISLTMIDDTDTEWNRLANEIESSFISLIIAN